MINQEAFTPTVEGKNGCDHVFTPWQGNEHMGQRECSECGLVEFRSRSLAADEPLVEAMTATSAPNAFRRSQRAALGALRAPQADNDDALVEIMAEALWRVSAEPEHGDNWAEVSASPWGDNFREHARAALNALREHGKEMGI